MKKKISWILIFLLFVWINFQIDCFTLTGLVVGSAIGPGKATIPGWKIGRVMPGAKITVFLKAGRYKSGIYKGVSYSGEAEYAEKYAQSREQNRKEIILPDLGEKITIQTIKGARYENILFQGFDSNAICVKYIGMAETFGLDLKLIQAVHDQDGNPLDIAKINKLFTAGKIPFLSAIQIISNGKIEHIPLDNISEIEIPEKSRAVLTGLLAGVTVDAIWFFAILGAEEEASCPLVYSFDGKKYVLDSETFSGSVFKAAQRTDWDNLDHLEEIKGDYHLKIMNRFQETQYIDEIKLFAVDHPRGSDVVPSFSGKIHTILKPVNVERAVDWAGNNVLKLLKEKDEHFWISNPFE